MSNENFSDAEQNVLAAIIEIYTKKTRLSANLQALLLNLMDLPSDADIKRIFSAAYLRISKKYLINAETDVQNILFAFGYFEIAQQLGHLDRESINEIMIKIGMLWKGIQNSKPKELANSAEQPVNYRMYFTHFDITLAKDKLEELYNSQPDNFDIEYHYFHCQKTTKPTDLMEKNPEQYFKLLKSDWESGLIFRSVYVSELADLALLSMFSPSKQDKNLVQYTSWYTECFLSYAEQLLFNLIELKYIKSDVNYSNKIRELKDCILYLETIVDKKNTDFYENFLQLKFAYYILAEHPINASLAGWDLMLLHSESNSQSIDGLSSEEIKKNRQAFERFKFLDENINSNKTLIFSVLKDENITLEQKLEDLQQISNKTIYIELITNLVDNIKKIKTQYKSMNETRMAALNSLLKQAKIEKEINNLEPDALEEKYTNLYKLMNQTLEETINDHNKNGSFAKFKKSCLGFFAAFFPKKPESRLAKAIHSALDQHDIETSDLFNKLPPSLQESLSGKLCSNKPLQNSTPNPGAR